MTPVVIKNKGQQIIPLTIIVGLVSLPVWGVLFFQEQIQAVLLYCRETIIVQYGAHPLMVLGLILVAGSILIGLVNLAVLWWRELTQTRAIRRWATLRLVAEHERICLVEATEAFAITVGYIRPTIIYTTGLLALLTEVETEAVLAHEIAHQSRRDPLRRLGLYSLMKLCFFWPALRGLARYYEAQQETRADRIAAASVGSAVVVSSMKKIVATMVAPQPVGLSSCAFSFSPERLLASQSGRPQYQFQFSLGELFGSGLTLALMIVSVIGGTVSAQTGDGKVVSENQLCQYVAEHEVVVGFSPLLTQSSSTFEPALQAYLVWRR